MCRSTRPDTPSLIYPDEVAFNLPSSVEFQWDSVDYFGILCPGRGNGTNRVELLLDRGKPFPETVVGFVDSSLNTSETSSVSSITIENLYTGQYYWQVRAVNVEGITAVSTIRTFTVCVDTPPRSPLLLLPRMSEMDVHPSVTLEWLPTNYLAGDFGMCSRKLHKIFFRFSLKFLLYIDLFSLDSLFSGLVCDSDNVNRQLLVYLDTINPPQKTVGFLIHSDSQLSLKLEVDTDYYWFVRASNGLFTTDSQIYHFRTRKLTCENTGNMNFIRHSNSKKSSLKTK